MMENGFRYINQRVKCTKKTGTSPYTFSVAMYMLHCMRHTRDFIFQRKNSTHDLNEIAEFFSNSILNSKIEAPNSRNISKQMVCGEIYIPQDINHLQLWHRTFMRRCISMHNRKRTWEAGEAERELRFQLKKSKENSIYFNWNLSRQIGAIGWHSSAGKTNEIV